MKDSPPHHYHLDPLWSHLFSCLGKVNMRESHLLHSEPRFLASQKLLHHDNKKDSLSLSYFVDLRRILNRLGTVRNARSDRWSLIAAGCCDVTC